MSNNWKYSSLGQRERLALIKKGNSDVYNTEKEQNKKLREVRTSLGLSTDDIDNWDNIIDSANRAANNPRKTRNVPYINSMNSREAKVNREYWNYVDDLKAEANLKKDNAYDKAEKDTKYLEEWLANNGYSSDGYASKKGHEDISEQLSEIIDSIDRDFKAKEKSARERFLALLGSMIKKSK